MLSLKERFIIDAVGTVVDAAAPGQVVKVMDLGCGGAGYVPALLDRYPSLQYVGVEPIPASFAAAEALVGEREHVTLHHQLGYDEVPGETPESCDLVFSLSALEHIKQLERFIALSARYVRSGGTLVHRYDLGHALHPHSLKERLHVFLGNRAPWLLPERQFVRYVAPAEVAMLYTRHGVTPTATTYHQLRSHKAIEKYFRDTTTHIVADLYAWEKRYQTQFREIPEPERLRLLPAVAVWGRKEG